MSGEIEQRGGSLTRARRITAALQGFIILLLLGLIALYANTTQRHSIFQNSIREDALWHVNQFDRSVRRLHEDVALAEAYDATDPATFREISSAFDILYSQFTVIEESAFGRDFLTDEVTAEVRTVGGWVRRNVPLYDRIAAGWKPDPAEMTLMRKDVDSLLNSTTNLLSLTIGRAHNSRADARETIFQVQVRGAIIITFLIVSVTVLILMLRRQLRTMRLAATEMECVSEELKLANQKLSDKAAWLRSEVDKAMAEIRDRDIEIVDRLSLAASYKDSELGSHTKRVGAYSELIARHLGLPKDFCADLRLASPMHDIGKVAIPDAVLMKAGPLTEEEFLVMQRHTVVGGQILSESRSPLLQLAADIAIYHHEHWNGRGYPNHASGETIPLSARIVAVADTFDALTTIRPYKIAWPRDRAIEYILERAGDQFDPQCVEAFEKALGEIKAIMDEEMIAVA